MVPGGVGPDFVQLGGDVFVMGSAAISERGLLVHTASTTDLTTYTTKVSLGTSVGTYYHRLTGLTAQTTYYVRAYATNADGTGYGSVYSFTTTEEAPDFDFETTEIFVALAPVSPRGATHSGGAVPAQTFTRVKTLVGSKTATGNVDGSPATARFGFLGDIVIDAAGNKYVSDKTNHTIRKVTPNGTVSTLAGNGTAGYAVGTGTAAQFNTPTGLGLGPDGFLYVADSKNYVVRKVNTTTGEATLYAGMPGVSSNQNGKAIGGAAFTDITGLTVDGFGYVYVVDKNSYQRVARISPEGMVQSFSANFSSYAGDIAVDGSGTLYRTSTMSQVVSFRFGDPSSIKSVYGATSASLALDAQNDYVYCVSDYFTSNGLEEINLDAFGSGNSTDPRYFSKIAGYQIVSSMNDPIVDSVAQWSTFISPGGMAFDSDGYLWITDRGALRRMEMQGYRLARNASGGTYTHYLFEKLTRSSSVDFKLNPRSGNIEGTPLDVGTYNHFVIASNKGGHVVKPLNVKIEWAAQWTGLVSTDWFDPSNWYPTEVPGEDVWVSVNSSSSVYFPTIEGNVRVKTLWLTGSFLTPVPLIISPNSTLTVTSELHATDSDITLAADSTGYGNLYTEGIGLFSRGLMRINRQMYFAADPGETSKTFLISSPFGDAGVRLSQLMLNSSTYDATNPPAWISNDPATTPIHYWKIAGLNTNWAPVLNPDGDHYFNNVQGVQGYSVFMGQKNGTTFVSELPAVITLSTGWCPSMTAFDDVNAKRVYLQPYDYDGTIAFTGAVDNKSEGSWNLIGTGKTVPYDWTGQVVPANVGGVMRVRQGTGWRTIAKDANANLYGSEFIPPMQAFWAPWKNKSTSQLLTFSPDNLAYHSKNKVKKTEGSDAYFHLELKSTIGSTDRTLIALHSEATVGEDFSFEAGKFYNDPGVPTFFSRSQGAAKHLNYLPHLEDDQAVPLSVYAPTGSYTIAMSEASIPNGYFAWLEDRELQRFTPLNEATYSFEHARGGEEGRFVVHMTTQKRNWDAVPPAVFTAWEYQDQLFVQSFRFEGKVKWSVVDGLGKTVAQSPRAILLDLGGKITVDLPADLTAGLYFIRIEAGDRSEVVRWVIQ
jgi:sugar lactone lactonase YvrE